MEEKNKRHDKFIINFIMKQIRISWEIDIRYKIKD